MGQHLLAHRVVVEHAPDVTGAQVILEVLNLKLDFFFSSNKDFKMKDKPQTSGLQTRRIYDTELSNFKTTT